MASNVVESLRAARGWINYNPGPPFDFVAGANPATEEQLTMELGRLHAAGFRGLVTNTMAFGLERAPQIAKECGFEHVVVKLWWQDDELLTREKANLDAALTAVDAVCMGNEVIQKGVADHDRLVREVNQARERFGLPVTTGFQPPDWQYFPDLATTVGDFSFLNVHPWWVLHRNDPLAAAAWSPRLTSSSPGPRPCRPTGSLSCRRRRFQAAQSLPKRPRAPRPRTRSASMKRFWPLPCRSSGSTPSTRR